MSELRESFPTLEIAGTGAGQAAEAKQQGDAASGYGAIGFSHKDSTGNLILAPVRSAGESAASAPAVPALVFKDSSGNLVYPQLNALGQIQVSTAILGINKSARGSVGGNQSQVTVATLSLTASKTYRGLEILVSCFRDAVFQVIQNDNGSLTVLADIRVGSGQYSMQTFLERLDVVAGATGTQQLLVKALNLNSVSDLTAAIATTEF